MSSLQHNPKGTGLLSKDTVSYPKATDAKIAIKQYKERLKMVQKDLEKVDLTSMSEKDANAWNSLVKAFSKVVGSVNSGSLNAQTKKTANMILAELDSLHKGNTSPKNDLKINLTEADIQRGEILTSRISKKYINSTLRPNQRYLLACNEMNSEIEALIKKGDRQSLNKAVSALSSTRTDANWQKLHEVAFKKRLRYLSGDLSFTAEKYRRKFETQIEDVQKMLIRNRITKKKLIEALTKL